MKYRHFLNAAFSVIVLMLLAVPAHASNFLYVNAAKTSIAVPGITNASTQIPVVNVGVFPDIPEGKTLVLTLHQERIPGVQEIVHCSGYNSSGDVDYLVVERGKEGTTAQPWIAGTVVGAYLTAGMLEDVDEDVDAAVLKLSGIEDNANNYVHPATHPPSIIAETTSDQFVSAAQIASWDAKADGFFTQNGTGAVEMTIELKAGQWVTPEDFGGDIQKALDASRIVALHAGATYQVEDTITLDDNQVLLGFGATIKRKAGAGIFDLIANEDQISGDVGIVIRDVKVDGNKDTDGLVATDPADRFSGISLVNVARAEVSGCTVTGTVNAEAHGGIWVQNCTDSRISRNTVTGNDRTGILYFGGARNVFSENIAYSNSGSGMSGGSCTDAQFIGNTSYNNGAGGTYSGINVSGNRSRAIGNVSYGNTGSGLALGEASYPTNGAVVSANVLYGNTLDGISSQYSDSAIIIGNTCTGNARHNIRIYHGSDDVAVVGNEASGATGANSNGIYVEDGDRARLVGNRCAGNGANGINIGANSPDGIAEGNVCVDNGKVTASNIAGIILNASTGWVVKGNQCFDTQSSPTQESGIWIAGGSGNSVEGNRLTPNKTYAIRETGSPLYSRNNNKIGDDSLVGTFKATASSTATIVTNDNAFSVSKVKVWPINADAVAKIPFVSSVAPGVSFTITLPSVATGSERYAYEIE